MAYADYLSHTWESRILDQKAFREWENGLITTEECYKRYLLNNGIKKAYPLYHEQLFSHWLNSLGYRRSIYG